MNEYKHNIKPEYIKCFTYTQQKVMTKSGVLGVSPFCVRKRFARPDGLYVNNYPRYVCCAVTLCVSLCQHVSSGSTIHGKKKPAPI